MAPKYTAAERRERAEEVARLRDRAVRSWNRDDGTKGTAIVMLTFADYLKLTRPCLCGRRGNA